MVNFKNLSFVAFYGATLTTLLLVFTIVFFSGVVSKNSVEIVRHYLTNIALVDPSVADIIQATSGLCDGSQTMPSPNVFSGSLASYMAYGVGGLAVVLFVLHMRWRILDRTTIFSRNEYKCLAMLLIPAVTEIVVHFCVYVRFKYFSNVYLVKLMKNMRLRADLQYLNDLWLRDATKINASGTTSNGVCVTNCLSETDRTALMTKLSGYLDQYNTLIDGTERGSVSPSSAWQKILALPGIVGTATMLAIFAMIARAAYELNLYNRPFLIGILTVSVVYLVFVYLLQSYTADAESAEVADGSYVSAIFCSSEMDAISNLVRRDLANQDSTGWDQT